MARRAALERSAQESLRRSRSASSKRTLSFKSPPGPPPKSPGAESESKHAERSEVTPPPGPSGSRPAPPGEVSRHTQQRVEELESAMSRMQAKLDFALEGFQADLAGFQQDQKASNGELLDLLKQSAGPQQNAQIKNVQRPSRQQRDLEELQRNRADGKLQCSDEQFDILCHAMGKTSAKVQPHPPLPLFLSSGLSSKGFSSFGLDDFPTNAVSDGYSSIRMDEIRAMRANKAKLLKAFETEESFFEFFAEKGFLKREHEHFVFFSTLLFQTRELRMRDKSWDTSKAYLTRLWTTQANEGRPWLELVGKTSSKRYLHSILPEFATHIDSVRYNQLRDKLESATKPKKSKDRSPPGKAKKSEKFNFYCDWHNSWFPEAAHTGSNACKKVGKQRPGPPVGP